MEQQALSEAPDKGRGVASRPITMDRVTSRTLPFAIDASSTNLQIPMDDFVNIIKVLNSIN